MEKDFMWGTATASYQVEGAYQEDERKESIWDSFCRQDGKVYEKQNGDIACDEYHLYKQDFDLLVKLGVTHYRFSIAWPRIIKDKKGSINQKGIQYYINVCEELQKRHIKPVITLYHWDMPMYLEEIGGFLNRDIVDYFVYYVKTIVTSLKGLCYNYITINEPQCIIGNGLFSGEHAPGKKLSIKDCLQASHILLLCHGRAVQAIRQVCPEAKIGFSPTSRAVVPCDDTEESYDLAAKEFFKIDEKAPFFGVSLYSDPVFLGDYPKEYYRKFKDILPDIKDGDLRIISEPLDYLYQNMYSGDYYTLKKRKMVKLPKKIGAPESNIWWGDVVPETLYYGPRFLYERYHMPIIISENGMCCHDCVSLDNKVHDANRVDFLHRYLSQLKRAIKAGVNIRGYFYWSFLDNFEWALGYTKRFGLVYVDYQTEARYLKESFNFYKTTIKKNGKNL